jgi:cytochrome b561
MQLLNSKEKFGLVTKLLHWGFFVLFIAQYFLVYRREYFTENSPESMQYILLHKSFGVIILGMAVFFILWRKLGSRPSWPNTMTHWQKWLAKIVHLSLYFVLLAMPISGILMSQYYGYPVAVFGHDIPNLVSENKELSSFFHEMHEVLSFAIMGIVGLHIVGALVHHFYYRDRTLKNML